MVERIKCGETVVVNVYDPEWCLITWRNKTGYMMTEFLILPETVLYTVTIPHLTKEQAEALKNEYFGVDVVEERG